MIWAAAFYVPPILHMSSLKQSVKFKHPLKTRSKRTELLPPASRTLRPYVVYFEASSSSLHIHCPKFFDLIHSRYSHLLETYNPLHNAISHQGYHWAIWKLVKNMTSTLQQTYICKSESHFPRAFKLQCGSWTRETHRDRVTDTDSEVSQYSWQVVERAKFIDTTVPQQTSRNCISSFGAHASNFTYFDHRNQDIWP